MYKLFSLLFRLGGWVGGESESNANSQLSTIVIVEAESELGNNLVHIS